MSLPKNPSRISSDLLELFEEFTSFRGSGTFQSRNDLIQLSENGTKVAVRITTSDAERLLPILEDLGFEVLGSSPELNFVEGFIPITSIPWLESLSAQGLLGVMSVPRPFLKSLVNSQANEVGKSSYRRAILPACLNGKGQEIVSCSSLTFSAVSFKEVNFIAQIHELANPLIDNADVLLAGEGVLLFGAVLSFLGASLKYKV